MITTGTDANGTWARYTDPRDGSINIAYGLDEIPDAAFAALHGEDRISLAVALPAEAPDRREPWLWPAR